jgi:hypothetical protein
MKREVVAVRLLIMGNCNITKFPALTSRENLKQNLLLSAYFYAMEKHAAKVRL